jgi:hypothetical protein
MYTAGAANEQLFHPYFDDWDTLELVQATIVISDSVYVDFSINVGGLPPAISARAIRHFDHLELAGLYSSNACIELVQKKASFTRIVEADGPEALRQELQLESESRRLPFPNAWQPVLYRALAANDEFIHGGFAAIEE